MRKIVNLIWFIGLPIFLRAQPDTCSLRFSLLTCSPGSELYSTFGHSALRVVDSTRHTDEVYNYGTFDFNDPSFYSKFVQGKLLYFVSVDSFENFVYEYREEQRGIVEQVLNLSCGEKQKLIAALQENALEQNKYYKYDFIVDNCTTRLRDIVFRNAAEAIRTKNIRENRNVTFRKLIHEYLDKGNEYWSKLGIDVLLGRPLDKTLTNNEAMFLPDYLLKGFDSTLIGDRPLILEKTEILAASPAKSAAALLSPFLLFLIVFALVAIVSFIRGTSRLLSVIDFILFFLVGVLGIFLLFMWFATDHPECRNNFNLVWACPLHLPVVFLMYGRRKWVRYYFLIQALLLFLLLVVWEWMPQEMNNALVPVVCLLLLRSFIRFKNPTHAQ